MASEYPPVVTMSDAHFQRLPKRNGERVSYDFIDNNYVLEEAQRALEFDLDDGLLAIEDFRELLIAHLGIPIKTSERLDKPDPSSLTMRQMTEAQAMKVRHAQENDPDGFTIRSKEALDAANYWFDQAGVSPSILGQVSHLSMTLPLELVADKQQMAPILNIFLYHRLGAMTLPYIPISAELS